MNRTIPSRFGLAGVVLAGCLAAAPSAAQFAVVDAQRAVAIEGHLLAVDTLSGDTRRADAADAQASPPLTAARLQVGLSLELPDALADAQGRAVLDAAFGERTLSFSALADVNATGRGDGSLALSGWALASVTIDLHFVLAQASPVRLAMSSEVVPLHEDDFRFLLARDDGTPLWQQTAVVDGGGQLQRSFVRDLFLEAGAYTLAASLVAQSRFEGTQAFAGRTGAQVLLSVVPEPGSAVLALAGLAGLAGFRRHRRR